MKTLAIDIETYSSVDLVKSGVYKYVSAPDFSILLLAYSYKDESFMKDSIEEVRVIDVLKYGIPEFLINDLTNDEVVKTAFNVAFERTCLSEFLGIHLPINQWRCTMVHCLELGLPSSLDGVAKFLKLDTQKDSKGKSLISYFSKPCKATKLNGQRTRNLPDDDIEKWKDFMQYCRKDVEVEMAVRNKIENIPIPKSEQTLWELDQKLNDKGIKIDMKLIENAIMLNAEMQLHYINIMKSITKLSNPKSTIQLKKWVQEKLDIQLDSFDKATIVDLINCNKYDNFSDVIRVLKLKLMVSKTSVSKYQAMSRSEVDGVVRGVLQFYGASRTGRWAGRIIQVHNLPRNYLNDLDTPREVIKEGELDWFDTMYNIEDLSDISSQLVRTALIPHEKHNTFAVADFSAIEARVLAWVCGEKWRIDVFNSHGKIYEASASEMFKVPIENIGKNSPLRQKGKIAELALGYGGGVGALTAMGALSMGIEEDELQPLVDTWRKSNLNIVKFWKDIEKACFRAVEYKEIVKINCVSVYMNKGILMFGLPTGRSLSYVKPKIAINKFGSKSLTYEGMNQTTKKWEVISTFGGKITENIIQAIARDCLADTMVRIDQKGYEIIFHVHDEVIVECEKSVSKKVLKDLEKIMGEEITWAKGLPLKAEGYITEYYKKD